MYNLEEIKNTILQGHILDILKNIPSETIDMVITSPPYYGLRNYNTNPVIWGGDENCNHQWESFIKKGISGGTKSKKVQIKNENNFQIVEDSNQEWCPLCEAWKGELGAEPTFHMYINHLLEIFNEINRILKKEGSCWVNLGDSYSGSCQGAGHSRKGTKQNTVRGTKYMSSKDHKSLLLNTEIPKKSLMAIPDRFKIAMIDNGWIARNEIIWEKNNAFPSSVKDRFTADFEKLYFFTKKQKYYFKQQLEPVSESSIQRINQKSFDTQVGGEKDYGKTLVNPNRSARKALENFKNNFTGFRNKRCVWNINTQPLRDTHFATFPEKLLESPIDACCPENGIVLDPFMGSGTTAIVALKQNKNYIGIELNSGYIEIANKRINEVEKNLAR